MNEKILMQDIIEQVTKKHGMARKDTETFVRGMFELIADALETENYVKIKGLGTFKLTEVDSRESVNVNTGERIEIQGHTKVTFTPDATMKDQINKPFAHFETVILNEGTRTEDMEAEEIPAEEPMSVVQVEVAAVEEGQSISAAEEAEKVVAPVAEETAGEAAAVEPEPMVEKQEEAPVMVTPSVAEEQTEEDEEKERKTPWGIIIAIILILCLAGGIYWYIQLTSEEPQIPTTVVETTQETTPVVQPQDTIVQEVKADSVVKPEIPVAVKPEAPKVILNDTVEYEITGTKTTLILQPGETLVKLALRFYGTKNLWQYIVQHNQDVITDADRVPIGTTLRIPELSPKK